MVESINNEIKLFEGNKIRSSWDNEKEEYYFSIIDVSELLPLVEVGASWEVCAFVSHIYLPSSSGSPYPDIFYLI